jgi:hypothetical protein
MYKHVNIYIYIYVNIGSHESAKGKGKKCVTPREGEGVDRGWVESLGMCY